MLSRKLGFVYVICALTIFCISAEVAGALTFNFTPTRGMSQQAINGFQQAGTLWSALFSDPVTVNIKISFSSLGSGILGSTGYASYSTSYASFRSALLGDVISADDATAASHISTGSAFNMVINRTANSPYGRGSAVPYVDSNGNNNNKTINMTTANAKALGLLKTAKKTSDASIAFSNSFQWDFNPSDGITSGQFDFVGIAAHEIGHVLGFVSGVDVLDYNSSSRFFQDSAFTYVNPLDLFRYSTFSAGFGIIDWSADARDKYFSIDAGATDLGSFSTGEVWGDGYQASHWKDDLGLGIMDPTAAPGERLSISALDIEAMDVVGWNLGPSAGASSVAVSPDNSSTGGGQDGFGMTGLWDEAVVPEPGTVFMIASAVMGLAGIAARRVRRMKA